jgi:hypothetical protein
MLMCGIFLAGAEAHMAIEKQLLHPAAVLTSANLPIP